MSADFSTIKSARRSLKKLIYCPDFILDFMHFYGKVVYICGGIIIPLTGWRNNYETFEFPEYERIVFGSADIVTTSGCTQQQEYLEHTYTDCNFTPTENN